MADYLLEMKEIKKSFSGVEVLKGISFNLLPGEVHVLLGENGAGKSTLMKILSGAERKSSGTILLEGKETAFKHPIDGIKNGISVIYQELNIEDEMTVAENIFLGREINSYGFVNKGKTIEKAKEVLEVVGLSMNPDTRVKKLSIAQKQMIEISKFISMQVKVLVLDEPTATLTEKEKNKLFEIIKKLKAQGVGIVYISHRIQELLDIGDRVTVLRNGEWVDTKKISEVTEQSLIQMMVGKNVSIDKKNSPRNSKETILKVEHLSDGNLAKDVTFELKRGTLLGVAGLVGSGRSEAFKTLIGATKKIQGDIFLNSKKVNFHNPNQAKKHGIVYLSEDRKEEGLIQMHSVLSNMVLPNTNKIQNFGFVKARDEKAVTESLIEDFRIVVPHVSAKISSLSGGNQQKVNIAKWVYYDSEIYIIDEPTRGIDVGARYQIYKIIDELVDKGASVIMISSDMTEILKMSDEILVFNNGRTVATLENNNSITKADVLGYAIGGKISYEEDAG